MANKYTDFHIKIKHILVHTRYKLIHTWYTYIPDICLFLNSQYPNLDFWTQLQCYSQISKKVSNHFWQPTFSLVHKNNILYPLVQIILFPWFNVVSSDLLFHSPTYLKETLGARIIHFHLGIFGTVGALYYCYIY